MQMRSADRVILGSNPRDQAAHYQQLAETAEDPLIKQEHFELAAVCEEVANHIEDRLTGG